MVMYPKWFLYDKVHEIGIQQGPLKSSVDANTDPSAGQLPTQPCGKQDNTSQQSSGKVSILLICASQMLRHNLVHTVGAQMFVG